MWFNRAHLRRAQGQLRQRRLGGTKVLRARFSLSPVAMGTLLLGEVVPPQRGAHGVGRESVCPWGCSCLPGACQGWAKAATASEVWERQQAQPCVEMKKGEKRKGKFLPRSVFLGMSIDDLARLPSCFSMSLPLAPCLEQLSQRDGKAKSGEQSQGWGWHL